MSTGWLVNDCLTCIPGTRTLWHDLLEAISGLQDKTNGHTDFSILARSVEQEAQHTAPPDYIIRNASFFPRININCPQICLLQDILTGTLREHQIAVCNAANLVVYNSPYTAAQYNREIRTPSVTIPLGTDFNLFCPTSDKQAFKAKWGIPEQCVVYVGASTKYPKGFDSVINLIAGSGLNFCLVMKDDFTLNHSKVRVFNKIPQDQLREILCACEVLLCTSKEETLHLAGVEAAACNLPLVVPRVGIYYDRQADGWGEIVTDGNYEPALKTVLSGTTAYSPRETFLSWGLDTRSCMEKWKAVVAEQLKS